MTLLCEQLLPSRRALLASSGALFSWAFLPKMAQAADGRDPRLIVLILRGALDGMSAVGPVGDPDYERLHGQIALTRSGPHAGLPLDGFFVLNPAMKNFARLYGKGQAAIVHAAATGYRDRSHFDGQDVLQNGLPGVGHIDSGWLNRAFSAIPRGARVNPFNALGIGAQTPLVLQGPAPVLGWAPQGLPEAGDDLRNRVMELYTHTDPVLAKALREGLATQHLANSDGMDATRPQGGSDNPAGMRQAARGAAKLMAHDDGPRIAAMAFDGWDTHVNEGGATGRFALLLGGLDGAFAEFETGLGDKWKNTAIVAVTEFGRTARINGTVGTDHGTATVVFLAGGAIKGGRVIARWPGLKDAQLYQNRDLAPTTDVRAVLKGLLADQFGLSAAVLGNRIFPESAGVAPLRGLIAA
ncbi:MAG: DUF1501 domain-containing protein [Hyphomicrobiales bacterium]|nr:DUF1501 domain-containing protein [Hyphomicrobiales bacterium]